jgi:hypothetical protein
MTCCCPSDGSAQERKKSKNGNAPNSQSMKDRGDMDEDEQAVDWWRSHHQSNDEGDETHPERNKSLDNSKSRMQQRNPLEKPYEISNREIPLRPQDGGILEPCLMASNSIKEIRPLSTETSNSIEVSEPEITPPWVAAIQLRQPSGKCDDYDDKPVKKITVIKPAEEEEARAKKDPPQPQKDPSAKYVHVASLKIPQSTQGVPKQRLFQTGQKSAAEQPENSHEGMKDHLSDVPSDVDSVTKDRYLLACHMLKNTLSAKHKTLVPIEREFIMTLLGDYESNVDAGSVISEDQVSAIERATLRLDNDPLFRDMEVPESDPVPPSPLTAASLQKQGAYESAKDRKRLLDIPKHPHTATLAKVKKSFLSNPCNPRSTEDAGAADIVLLVRDEDDDVENSDADTEEVDEAQLVRFDGWTFHKPAEHPFQILGADDPNLQTRVLTPSVMEALRGFFPYTVSESNFWLKFSLVRDGASLASLLATVRASSYTIIAVETNHGEVFGSFTGTPWRTGTKWFGTGEAFLWRLKKSRLTSPRNAKESNFENEMEVYPYTGYDDLVQYCTSKIIAVGGGDWLDNPCPFQNEPRGIGFMIDGDLAGGETNSSATFANPRLCKKASVSNEFSISNLEVWTLTPCLNAKDAAKLELQKLFVEENIR